MPFERYPAYCKNSGTQASEGFASLRVPMTTRERKREAVCALISLAKANWAHRAHAGQRKWNYILYPVEMRSDYLQKSLSQYVTHIGCKLFCLILEALLFLRFIYLF